LFRDPAKARNHSILYKYVVAMTGAKSDKCVSLVSRLLALLRLLRHFSGKAIIEDIKNKKYVEERKIGTFDIISWYTLPPAWP